jgi:hypothetical protein
MKYFMALTIGIIASLCSKAQVIQGIISTNNGTPLEGVSVFLKNTGVVTVSNELGFYRIKLTEKYKYISFKKVNFSTRSILTDTITRDTATINIVLNISQIDSNTIVVRSGENPAIRILKNAIKKRKEYNVELKEFSCLAYIKSSISLLKKPKRIFGQKVPDEVKADSTGNNLVQLSENITKVDYKAPSQYRFEVISGRSSGSDNGGGPNIPALLNFYEENINLGPAINPRGFISPLNDRALYFYKVKYEGAFVEEEKLIHKIKLEPKRNSEPVFSGYIMIVDGSWRMHSIDVLLTKKQQMQIIDSLAIQQIQAAITEKVWKPKTQIVTARIKIFGFDSKANYTNVFQEYNTAPNFAKNHFKKILMQYDTAFSKKSTAYWDSIRPLPLNIIEIKDYVVKDSLFKKEQDSLKKNPPKILDKSPIKLSNVLLTGISRTYRTGKSYTNLNIQPLIPNLQFNTVEGWSPQLNFNISKIRNIKKTNQFNVSIKTRYGISNKLFNATARTKLWFNTSRNDGLTLKGGSWIEQWNNDNTLDPLTNSLNSLFAGVNYLKNYQSKFATIEYKHKSKQGINFSSTLKFEDRLPLDNTTNYSMVKASELKYTPNYPIERFSSNFTQHQAFTFNVKATFQPGVKLVINSDGKSYPVGSKYPHLEVGYTKGLKNILNSDVDFDKWDFAIYDDVRLNLFGQLKYRFNLSGFINAKSVFPQDLLHVNGNQLRYFAGDYLNTFQLAPYYQYSNQNDFFGRLHVEHHFNGLFTNKIPLFNKLNWTLVGAANAFYINKNNYYSELSVGLENIFKVIRVDWINGISQTGKWQTGFKIGLGGIIGSNFKISFPED